MGNMSQEASLKARSRPHVTNGWTASDQHKIMKQSSTQRKREDLAGDIACLNDMIYDRSCDSMLFSSSLSFASLKMALPLP